MNRLLSVSLVLLVVGACKKKEEAKPEPAKPVVEAPKEAPKPPEPPKPAGGLVTKTNAKLKLGIDVPADAEIEDQTFDWPAFRANTEAFEDLLVEDATKMFNTTLDEDKKDSENDGECDFASFIKHEATPDGWLIQYKCKGADDVEFQKVHIRKKVGETSYQCKAKVKTAEALDLATKSCQSLKPAV